VNHLGLRVLHRQIANESPKLKGGPIWRGRGEVASGLGLDCAERVRRAASLGFAVSASFSARYSRPRRPDVGMEGHWFLVQTNYWLGRIRRALIDFQHVFHLLDVLIVEVGDAPHFFPATA
jgi:hypothetical protein